MKTLLKSLKPLACVCALAVAVASGRPAAAPQAARESHPLDTLDREVQKRFHNVIGFGMARIASQRRFAPETEEEKEAVRELKRAGYRVGLYLAGRAILDDVPEQNRNSKVFFGSSPAGQAFSGPIFLSSSGMKGLPTAAALWDETRRAMESFAAGSERYGFKSGEWEVETRPVRASEASCLKCHVARVEFKVITSEKGEKSLKSETKEDPPKLGDPLGVLLYVYKGRDDASARK